MLRLIGVLLLLGCASRLTCDSLCYRGAGSLTIPDVGVAACVPTPLSALLGCCAVEFARAERAQAQPSQEIIILADVVAGFIT